MNRQTLGETFKELARRRGVYESPTKGMATTPSVLEHTRVQPYHAAFDIRDGVMVIGFEVERPELLTMIQKVVHVGTVAREAVELFEGTQATIGGRLIRVLAPAGALPLIDVEVRRAILRAFLTNPQALSGRQLYDHLMGKWRQHVDFDHAGKFVIMVAWGLMTYVYPMFSSLPYLHLLGAKGTGKSQALDLLAQLARSGHKSRATAAVIGDLIEAQRPTLLFDQADHLTPDMIDLLADSYRAGTRRTIVHIDQRGERHARAFETFGPKAFAGIEYLDEDLADRAILITTSPAARQVDAIAPNDEEATTLREESYKWAVLNFYKLRDVAPSSDPKWPALARYRGRQRDLWLPIEVIMEALGVPQEDRDAAREYYARSQTSTKAELSQKQEELLRALLEIVGEKETGEVLSTALLESLRPRGEIDLDELDYWTPQKLGRALKSLNVLLASNRTSGRNARRYVIDGGAVRSTAKRYGLTD